MHFTSDYWNSMDATRKKINLSPSEIGISHGIGDVGEGLKVNVFRGAKTVELGFMGVGKGSRASPTGYNPESFSKEEREDIRALARINEVEVSTHATPNVFLSGFGEGGFRKEAQEQGIHEIKRAIDFAADATDGGPVVFHIAEFQRPIFSVEGEKFKFYPGEEKKAPIYIVDKRNGSLSALPRDATITRPLPKNKGDDPYLNPATNGKGEIVTETKTIADIEQEYYQRAEKEPSIQKEHPSVVSYIYKQFVEKNIQLERGEAQRYREEAKEYRGVANKYGKIREYLEEKKAHDPAGAFLEAMSYLEKHRAPDKDSPEYAEWQKQAAQDPIKIIKDMEDSYKNRADAWQKVSVDREVRAREEEEMIKNRVDIVDYGVKNSVEAIARTAMYAYDVEKSRHLKKPLWIAPENWTPEMYGAHPDEYKKLIEESRKKMQEELIHRFKVDEDEAKNIAKEHIKGTFDVGHANFWWKYFQPSKENEGDPVKARREFEQWLTKKAEKLTEEGIIGHVHLSDNFGYHDEHLAPGQGNVPTEEFVSKLKGAGFKGKFIAEPGGTKQGQEHTVWTESWKALSSPIYRIDGQTIGWSDISQSYFGKAPQSPYFMVGDYVPSKDWSLWSEVPLE